MTRKMVPVGAVTVAVAMFLLACSTATKPVVGYSPRGHSPEPSSFEPGPLVENVWRAHEHVVLSVLNMEKGEIDLDRLSRSIVFFEKVTGIMSNSHTYFGVLPTSELPDTLERWNQWYAENRHLLRIDPLSCQLEVTSETSPPGAGIAQP